MSDIALSESDLMQVCELLYRHTGLVFEPSKFAYIERRVQERLRVLGSRGFHAYFPLLCSDAQERQQLINLVTVNETFFFREEYQLRCLVNSLMPDLARRRCPGEPLKIWSLPCATGEEPYSIAIYLLERWPDADSHDIKIVGSDIDTRVLEQARRGLYAARSVEPVPERLRQRYFARTPAGLYQLVAPLRGSVDFTHVNVTDPRDTEPYRDFDVIFCRNLLIYFDEARRQRVADALHDALRDGGYLCLGHSESMSRISPRFQVRKFADAIVYQKAQRS